MLCGDLPLRRRLAGAGGDRGVLEGGAKYAGAEMKEEASVALWNGFGAAPMHGAGAAGA